MILKIFSSYELRAFLFQPKEINGSVEFVYADTNLRDRQAKK